MGNERLIELIDTVRSNLSKGFYTSEAAVAQSIVLPILQAVGWPTHDPLIVVPEYSIEGRRVDYALCNPPSKPYVFLEVKRVGNSRNADRQLFEYSFHAGVPLAVLTDGREWEIYLPGEQGSYDERKVYKIDLHEQESKKVADKFIRYLSFDNIKNGTALENARTDYKSMTKIRMIKHYLPLAWSELIRDEDPILIELLAEKVEDMCGYKPSVDECGYFIASLTDKYTDHSQGSPSSIGKKGTKRTRKKKIFVLQFEDTRQELNAKSAMVELFTFIARENPSAHDRFASLPHGKKRRYLAKNKYELYPGRKDLSDEYSVEIPGGWWLGTNYSSRKIEAIMHRLLEVTDPIVQLKISFAAHEVQE